MGYRRKQIVEEQKADFEHKLQDRLAFLSREGIESSKAGKDPLARKWKANIKASTKRLKAIADNAQRTEEAARKKAQKAAAPVQEPEAGKGEKVKKAPAAKEKKEKPAKPEKPKKAKESPEEAK